MAAEGLRFTDFYMASPVCSPSRGAMLTGCYPPRIGFGLLRRVARAVPRPARRSQPRRDHHRRRAAGRRATPPSIVGKWHCGDQPEFLPTRHGFDSYLRPALQQRHGPPGGFDIRRCCVLGTCRRRREPAAALLRDDEVIEQQPDQASLTARYVEEAVRFIRDNTRPAVLPLPGAHARAPAALRAGALRAVIAQRPLRRGGRMHRLGRGRAAARASRAGPRRATRW